MIYSGFFNGKFEKNRGQYVNKKGSKTVKKNLITFFWLKKCSTDSFAELVGKSHWDTNESNKYNSDHK